VHLYLKSLCKIYHICSEFVDGQNIAINVPRRTIIYGQEELTVTCSLLHYNTLLKVDSIQLLRNTTEGGEELMAALSASGLTTPTRTGFRVSGLLRPLWSAKLSVTVAKDFVDCKDDDREYICSLAGMDQLFNPVRQRTEAVPIHIAGTTQHFSYILNNFGNFTATMNRRAIRGLIFSKLVTEVATSFLQNI
jgi:hypothetical protein